MLISWVPLSNARFEETPYSSHHPSGSWGTVVGSSHISWAPVGPWETGSDLHGESLSASS